MNYKNKISNELFFPRNLILVPKLRQLRWKSESVGKNVQSFSKYDSFLTKDLASDHVQVRMAERSKALRSGRSLLL